MQKIVLFSLLALAGALGTLFRAGVTLLAFRILGPRFPWGTIVVNVLGCFMFGAVWALTETRTRCAPEVRLLLLTGFMGAFTTFSTYVFDTGMLAQSARLPLAMTNFVLQNAAGLAFLFVGIWAGRHL